MNASYLVDTDWAIHFFNGSPEVTRRLETIYGHGVGISIISLAELDEGVFYSNQPEGNQEALQELLRRLEVIEVDDATCRIFARERGRLRRMSQRLGDFDLLIGATALRHGLTLLTNNRRHFEMIENLTLESV